MIDVPATPPLPPQLVPAIQALALEYAQRWLAGKRTGELCLRLTVYEGGIRDKVITTSTKI